MRYVLLKLLEKFDAFHEYIFLVAIAWCLGLAEISELLGLSLEIGAFVAGVTIATSPIALYIADHLKPLRDFFLVLFFFSIGGRLLDNNPGVVGHQHYFFFLAGIACVGLIVSCLLIWQLSRNPRVS